MMLGNQIVGKRIRYSGDVCNAPREGIITDVVADRFGTNAVILWDADETIGWDDMGEAVHMNEPVSKVSAHLVGSARWALI